MKNNRTTETLICQLTDSERREYGIKLATALGDMTSVEEEKKREMDHFKDRIAGLQARVDELSRKTRDGKEWRHVECEIFYSTPDKMHKQVVRLDTGETVRTELMTEKDLQTVMPLDILKDAMDPGDRLEVSMGGTMASEFEKGADAEWQNVEPEGEDVMIPGDDDEEPEPEMGKRDLSLGEINALLTSFEGVLPRKRKSRLTELLYIHGRENILKFDCYKTWNDADPHVVKVISALIKELRKNEAEPSTDY